MEESESEISTSAADEELCAFLIKDASRLRRIVELMPERDLPANFLNTLWVYAVKHDCLVDLANVFLGFDANHRAVEGNENCDWFWRCSLSVAPVRTNEFFFTLMTYARTRAHLANGTYDDWHDNSLAMYDWLTYYKEHDIGKEIIGIDDVLTQLYAKYKIEVELERRRETEGDCATSSST